MSKNTGILFIISGPSGVGKGTLVNALIKNRDMHLSISVTTRSPRTGEVDGVHYHFKTVNEYHNLNNANAFYETFQVFNGDYYGTLKQPVDNALSSGRDVILEIDVQGGLEVKKKLNDAVLIFILPPSLYELKNRLKKRNTEDENKMSERLAKATKEIEKYSMYDYILVNDDFDVAVKELIEIIDVEKRRALRNTSLVEKILKD